MASEERIQVFQGTLDLILLRALATMGPQHGYGLASRLKQIADGALPLNAGTMYAALVRLAQRRWVKGPWEQTPANRPRGFASSSTMRFGSTAASGTQSSRSV